MMKEVAIYDAKNNLSALIAEIEATGEEVLVTRHGKPVARLSRACAEPTSNERSRLMRYLLSRMDELAREHPESAEPVSWEQLKEEMDGDRL